MKIATLLPLVLAIAAPAAAQTTSRPGPWVFDARGITSPVPGDTTFYPALDTTALIPSRGFGVDFGLHVYLFNLGASRVGIGATVAAIRAVTKPPPPIAQTPASTTPAVVGQSVQLDMVHMAPQISFNFGAREGWSYLSAGIGSTAVNTRTAGVLRGERATGELWDFNRLWDYERFNAMNVGGGARWFFKSHLAFGFDIRVYRIEAGTAGALLVPPVLIEGTGEDLQAPPPAPAAPERTPGMMLLTVGAGFSFR